MKFIRYFTSMRPIINIILLCAVASIVIMEVWLNSIPEIVSWGNEFGKVYFKICISIISSYVFYFIVVHIKSVQDKENINIFVEKEIKSIIKKHEIWYRNHNKKLLEQYNIDFNVVEISQIIKNMFTIMPFLDTELIRLLSEILNSKYCLSKTNTSDLRIDSNTRDKNKYEELHKQLKKYYELNLESYK